MSEKPNTKPQAEQGYDDSNFELNLNIENREYLNNSGRLQVAVYDFASRQIEKFKLSKNELKDDLNIREDLLRELAIARAQKAHSRAQERAANAKYSKSKQHRQKLADAAEKRLRDLQAESDASDAKKRERRDAITDKFEGSRDINLLQQTRRYQTILTKQALKNEGLDRAERNELVGELTKEQADNIGVNALFHKVIERRHANIESQLEDELNPDEIDRLTVQRDRLANMVDEAKQNLDQAIADALNAESKPEPESEPESKPEEKPADTDTDQKPKVHPTPATIPKPKNPNAKPEKPVNNPENDSAESDKKFADDGAEKPVVEPEKAPEQNQAELADIKNRKRTKLIRQLEKVVGGYSYTSESSDDDNPKIDKLAIDIFGENAGFMLLAEKTFGQWGKENPEQWNKLSQSQRDQREEAWSLLVDWIKR